MAYRGIRLSPSVICLDWMNLRENLEFFQSAAVDSLHYDIRDGYFVPEFGLPLEIVSAVRSRFDIPSSYHLMVEEPRRVYDLLPEEEGARVSIHYEACRNLHKELVQLRRMGLSPGVIISPTTSLDHIEYVIEEVDAVTIMTHNPEYPSEEFIPQILSKIGELKEWRGRVGYELDIVVDGSVTRGSVPDMARAGVDELVLETAALFGAGGALDENWQGLTAAIDEARAEA